MTFKTKTILYTLIFLASLVCFHRAHGATEFVSIVDTYGSSAPNGADYSSLSSWENGVQTDLTSANTQVFAGTRVTAPSDGATAYLCTSGNSYRGESARIDHATATQILVDTIAGAVTENATDYWYSTNTCSGGTKYFTLSNGGDSAIAIAKCRTSDGSPDTATATVDGWATSATNYIKIWTDPSEPYRHSGVWDDSKYRIYKSASDVNSGIILLEHYVKIDGLQINQEGSAYYGIREIIPSESGDGQIEVSNNIFKGGNRGISFSGDGSGQIKTMVWNNMVYNVNLGSSPLAIRLGGTATYSHYIYNNTVLSSTTGIIRALGTVYAKNNLAYNNTTDYSGTFDATSTYNITSTAPSSAITFGASADSGTTTSTSAGKLVESGQNFLTTVKVGMVIKNTTDTTYTYVTAVDSDTQLSVANDIMPTGKAYTIYTNMYGNVTFEDSANNDFHLDSSDTVAKNKGANLYADGSLAITTDIDNNARPNSATTFDIGADENIAKIYRSVGPSATTAITTGTTNNQTNHLTLSGLYATFELPLPDNVGVGDAIQYDANADGSITAADGIAFIDKRFSNQKYRIKKADGTAPTAMAVPDIDWSLFRAYTSLSLAEAGTENAGIDSDLVNFDTGNRDIKANSEQWNFACYANGTTADTTAVTISGWTTSADNYLKIYTPTNVNEVGTSQRHSGVWDTNKYRLDYSATATYQSSISQSMNYVRYEGLQIKFNNNDYASGRGVIQISNAGVTANNTYIDNNLMVINFTTTNNDDFETALPIYDVEGSYYLFNNILYKVGDNWGAGAPTGIYTTGTANYLYNNTISGFNRGINVSSTPSVTVAKNNIVQNTTTGYVGTFNTTSSTNNLSDHADAPGSNPQNTKTVAFVDSANGDFHLAPGDNTAKNIGTDLSNDLNLPINTDIDDAPNLTKFNFVSVSDVSNSSNFSRPYGTTWDIGADEVITRIYRSIGVGATAPLATGASNHLNISGSTATFDTALSDSIGVGDALEYDDDNDGDIDANDSIAFISGRTSSTVFTIKTSTGGTPTAPSAVDEIHWNILRAYTSLSDAEAGTENTGIDSDLRAFDAGNRDIKANSEQWNFACYAGYNNAADTTATIISGWTTSPTNYVRVYTPYLTSEVGTSQRHSGKYDTNKYRLETTTYELRFSSDYVRIDGLQMKNTVSSGSANTAIKTNSLTTGSNKIVISNNILVGIYTGGANGHGINNDYIHDNVYIYNNIIYGFNGASGWAGIYSYGVTYAYGNTLYGNGRGIGRDTGTLVAKNNLAYSNTLGGDYTGTFDSYSTNNLSQDATAPGSNARASATVSFTSTTSGSEDFHLTPSTALGAGDAGAKDYGADLSQDPIFQQMAANPGQIATNFTDIDGAKHPLAGSGLSWDIGADESATPIYRSVGPSATTALDTGAADSNNLTISGSTMTVGTGTPDNVGVGDAIQYDSDNNGSIDAVAFISGRTSSTTYAIKSGTGAPPVPTTANDQDWSIYRSYASLADAESGNENSGLSDTVENFDDWTVGGSINADEAGRDIWTNNEQWNIAAYANGTTADTVDVLIEGWTTAATNYLRVYTPTATTEVGISQRHQGKWDDSKYHKEGTNGYPIIIRNDSTKIEGLQIKLTCNNYNNAYGISSGNVLNRNTWISNNIIVGVITGTSNSVAGISLSTTGSSANNYNYVWNNIIYGFINGSQDIYGGILVIGSNVTAYVYNNTVYNSYQGINRYTSGTVIAKNNISYNNTDNYAGTFDASGTNNLSGPGSDAQMPTTGARNGVTVAFEDSANSDFHLAKSDTGARNLGADLATDTYIPITTDIDGHTRPTGSNVVDIGADEGATAIYFSVGQNVTDHKVASNVSITSGVATFSVAQTATNMGIGDALVAGGNTYYITGKTSTTVWTVRTATGTVPADLGSTSVTSISHAFASLNAAVNASLANHAGDSSHLNTTDLLTNNFQLNIPCYYDSGADTTSVNTGTWTTGVPNYIKIYTPNNTTSEVNQSQRHSGKWDDGKYALNFSPSGASGFILQVKDIKIDGLQFYLSSSNPTGEGAIRDDVNGAGTRNIEISNNIIRSRTFGDNRWGGFFGYGTSASGIVKIRNNIFYDRVSSGIYVGGVILESYGATAYIYNNTFYNNSKGLQAFGGGVATPIVKNNLFTTNTADAAGTITDSYNASTNDNSKGLSAGGTGNRFSQTFSFIDATNKDFHLSSSDAGAKDYGANLSADTSYAFSTDIDGSSRSLWDIGADEGSVEMNATVMQSGGDYSSLSTWQTGMATDLTASGTMVFSGALTSTIADNASLYLCRSGVYQSITGTTVHLNATQALIESISSPTFVMAANDVWYTNSTCNSANYFTISTAGGNPAIGVAKIDGAWTAADTSQVFINGWTTGYNNYIKIYTTTAARHAGKWDDTKYRLVMTSAGLSHGLYSWEENLVVDGLQMAFTGVNNGGNIFTIQTTAQSNVSLSNSIITRPITTSNTNPYGIYINSGGAGSVAKIWNNIVYNFTSDTATPYALVLSSGNFTYYLYNNTSYNNKFGFRRSSGTAIAKNNLAYNNSTDYSGTFDASSANNISKDATSPNSGSTDCGGHSCRSQTVSFVNSNTQDFHLSTNDTAAKNSATSTYSDANLRVTTDIDGSARPELAEGDIGADEAATQIYYSVGQNTSDHSSGGNVSITSGVATFTVAQTATNLGVGDKLLAGGNTYYLFSKTDTTHWTLITATGSVPSNLSSTAVTSISHVYNSLSAAEAGAPDSSHLNTTNLVTGNYVLNIPCYYDTGADTTAVTVDGWTTGFANYIKIYTPNNTTSEVNQTQRHSGKWSDTAFVSRSDAGFNADIYILNDYVKVEGLQFDNATGLSYGLRSSGAYNYFSSNIIRNIPDGIFTENNYIYIYNNIIYGTVAAIYRNNGTNSYIYNNTIINNTGGYEKSCTVNDNLINNVFSNNTSDYVNEGCGSSPASTYNSTNNSAGGGNSIPAGTGNRYNQTFSFVDATNKDFHLAFPDTGAKGYGTNLMNDPYLAFSDDIDGQERSGNWSIGADQPVGTTVASSKLQVSSLTNGLVGYWSFDGQDISGTTAYDRSGNNLNGTLNGEATVEGARGQALLFGGTGTGHKVGVSPNTSINNLSVMTISTWINAKSYGEGNQACIISKEYNSGEGWKLKVYGPYSNLYFQVAYDGGTWLTAASAQNSFTSVDLNQWTQITVKWDGTANASGVSFYKNGVLLSHMASEETNGTGNRVSDATRDLQIGNEYFQGRTFDGAIDEVRVYNRALSAGEVSDLYHLGNMQIDSSQASSNKSGLVGMWSFDGQDISGNTAYDRSGNNNNGTINEATPALGKIGQALSFNGTTNYVISSSSNFITAQNQPHSMFAWVNPSDVTSAQGIVSFGEYNDSQSNSVLDIRNNHVDWCLNGANSCIGGSLAVPTNVWSFIGFVRTASDVTLYVNGASETYGSGNSGSIDADPILIGRSSLNGSQDGLFKSGKIDEVRVYNRALSPTEVQDLYNSGQATLRR